MVGRQALQFGIGVEVGEKGRERFEQDVAPRGGIPAPPSRSPSSRHLWDLVDIDQNLVYAQRDLAGSFAEGQCW